MYLSQIPWGDLEKGGGGGGGAYRSYDLAMSNLSVSVPMDTSAGCLSPIKSAPPAKGEQFCVPLD